MTSRAPAEERLPSHEQGQAFQRWLIPACLIALVIPLLVTPVLPLIDFYNHVARFYVLSHIQQDPALAQNYAAHWQIVPNLGLDIIGAFLLSFVPPLLGAKLIAFLILVVQFTGILALARALGVRNLAPPALLGVAVLYSYILNWGFANFLLSIGLAFWAVAFWLNQRHRPLFAAIGGCLLAILVFLAHGFGFALYGAILASIELGRWREEREPFGVLIRNALMIGLQAVVPALLFLSSPTGSSSNEALPIDKVSLHLLEGTLGNRLTEELFYRISTIVRVAESPYPAIDIALFLVVTLLLAWAFWRDILRVRPSIRIALALLVILTIVTPPAMFGVGFVSDRLPYVLILLAIAGLELRAGQEAKSKLLQVALIVLAIARTALVSVGWSSYRHDYFVVESLLKRLPPNVVLGAFFAKNGDRRDGGLKRCQMYPPIAVMEHHALTPLFADPTQQPLSLQGRVKRAASYVPPKPNWSDQDDYSDDAALAGMIGAPDLDFILLCGAERLRKTLPANVQRFDAGRFSLLRIIKK